LAGRTTPLDAAFGYIEVAAETDKLIRYLVVPMTRRQLLSH
jgi:hypothetical protein